jgi:S1-C subfamily serine protease
MNEPPVIPLAPWRERLQRLHSHSRSASLFALGVLAAFIALLLYSAFGPTPPPLTTQEVDHAIAAAIASVTPAPAYSALVYQAIRPSLVFIEVQTPDEEDEIHPGVGSGIIINTNGDILTSLHVVADATEITIYFADGSESAAQLIIAQPENDIAVLHASQPPLEVVPAILGNPNAMRVGDEAFVVGNPLGLYSSMSAGVISGFGRSFQPEASEERLEDLIQFDAAVNPGNSGGPLLNRYGQVVGIVTGLINPTEQEVFIGIGFAVPITTAAGAAGLPAY